MRFRKWFMASLVVLLVMPVATATMANAQDTATQYVQVGVWAPGLLTIDVEQQTNVGAGIPGTTVGNAFWMGIMNTTQPATGWEVLVTGTDLTDGWMNCDEWGNNCTIDSDPEIDATIPKSNIRVTGGNWQWWDEQTPNPISHYEGYLSETPLQIMTGTEGAWGGIGFDAPAPEIHVDLPADAPITYYIAELTYTIQAWTPAP